MQNSDYIPNKAFKDIQLIVDEVKEIYLESDKPFMVGYSGGKDSTVTLDIVLKALLQINPEDRTKEVIVFTSDTKLELDPTIQGIENSLESISDFALKNSLPVRIEKVEPPTEHSFWSMVVGKGYRLPSTNARFCTTRWKIDPQEKRIKEIIEDNGGFVSITGQRRDESEDRKQRLIMSSVAGTPLKLHNRQGCSLYTPIEHFSTNDVWSYINTKSETWVDADYLWNLYSDAAGEDGDECRTMLEAGTMVQMKDGSVGFKDENSDEVYIPKTIIPNKEDKEVDVFKEQNIDDFFISSFMSGGYKNTETYKFSKEKKELKGGDFPQCSGSARFGCWICPLFKAGKDKALINLAKKYDYLKVMEIFRNWLIKEHDSRGWSVRDVYRHGTHSYQDYNIDNHRKGMNSPGGLSLDFRKEIFTETMLLEEKVYDDREKYLIEDEEIKYIQETWIEEGDCDYSALALMAYPDDKERRAKEGYIHRSPIGVSEKHKNISEAVKIYKASFFAEWKMANNANNSSKWRSSQWSVPNQLVVKDTNYPDERFFAQASLELENKGIDSIKFARRLVSSYYRTHSNSVVSLARKESGLKELPSLYGRNTTEYMAAFETFKKHAVIFSSLKCQGQYYPSPSEINRIREEWKKDQLSFTTLSEMENQGVIKKPQKEGLWNEGTYADYWEQTEEIEEKGDVTLCESISIEDQMAFFDNFNKEVTELDTRYDFKKREDNAIIAAQKKAEKAERLAIKLLAPLEDELIQRVHSFLEIQKEPRRLTDELISLHGMDFTPNMLSVASPSEIVLLSEHVTEISTVKILADVVEKYNDNDSLGRVEGKIKSLQKEENKKHKKVLSR